MKEKENKKQEEQESPFWKFLDIIVYGPIEYFVTEIIWKTIVGICKLIWKVIKLISKYVFGKDLDQK